MFGWFQTRDLMLKGWFEVVSLVRVFVVFAKIRKVKGKTKKLVSFFAETEYFRICGMRRYQEKGS
jgi:hypothetical protein